MPDDQTPPPTELPPTPEPLPESFRIPGALVENWLAIPPETRVVVELRRADLNQFYFSVNRCIEAQYLFQDCMLDYSNGRTDPANAKMWRSQRTLIEAQNSLRQFMAAVMASAVQGDRT